MTQHDPVIVRRRDISHLTDPEALRNAQAGLAALALRFPEQRAALEEELLEMLGGPRRPSDEEIKAHQEGEAEIAKGNIPHYVWRERIDQWDRIVIDYLQVGENNKMNYTQVRHVGLSILNKDDALAYAALAEKEFGGAWVADPSGGFSRREASYFKSADADAVYRLEPYGNVRELVL